MEVEDEKIAYYLRKKGWLELLAKKEGALEESLFWHSIKTYWVVRSILEVLGSEIDLSETHKKLVRVGAAIHDAGKSRPEWQQYILKKSAGKRTKPISHEDKAVLAQVAEEIVKELEWDLDSSHLTEIVLAACQHMERTKQGVTPAEALLEVREKGLESPRQEVISQLISFADRCASIRYPYQITGVLQQIGFLQLKELLDFKYHQVARIRGISTSLLHLAAQREYESAGYTPLIYFPTGTVYVGLIGEIREVTVEGIEGQLHRIYDEFCEKFATHIPEAIVGQPTASMINVQRGFAPTAVRVYFRIVANRTGVKKPGTIKAESVRKYITARTISEEQGFDAAKMFLRSKSRYTKQFEIPKVKPAEEESLRVQAELAEINPEITVLKFFKELFTNAELCTPEMTASAAEEYNAIFGDGAFDRLKTTGTLNPVLDRLFAIDQYWQLPAKTLGWEADIRIHELPQQTRLDLLINKLTEITEKVYAKHGFRETTGYYDVLTEMMKSDLIEPRPKARGDIQKYAMEYLENWTVSKDSQQRQRKRDHFICPRCNAPYKGINLVAAELTDFKKKFTNRMIGGTSFNKGTSICPICELEYFLRFVALGTTPPELLVLYPAGTLPRDVGAKIVARINAFEAGLARFGGMTAEDFQSDFSFRNTYTVSQKIAENPQVLDRLGEVSAQEIVDLFRRKRSETTIKDLKKQVVQVVEGMTELAVAIEPVYGSLDAFAEVFLKHPDDPNIPRPLREEIDATITQLRPQVEFVYQTPNMILIEQKQPIASRDEADINEALQKLLVSCLLALYTGFSTVIVKSAETIPPTPEGAVRVPLNPHLRDLVGREWLTESEVSTWAQKIAASILLALRTKYPARTAIYTVLKAPTKGHLLRRIEMEHLNVTTKDVRLIEMLGG